MWRSGALGGNTVDQSHGQACECREIHLVDHAVEYGGDRKRYECQEHRERKPPDLGVSVPVCLVNLSRRFYARKQGAEPEDQRRYPSLTGNLRIRIVRDLPMASAAFTTCHVSGIGLVDARTYAKKRVGGREAKTFLQ